MAEANFIPGLQSMPRKISPVGPELMAKWLSTCSCTAVTTVQEDARQ